MTYKYIDHTADLGIEVKGSTFKALLINIGKAIFETQIKGQIESTKDITIAIHSESYEDLFIDWCRELVYNFSVKGFIPKEYDITLHKYALEAQLVGDVFDQQRHKVKIEIKNPTYHGFRLEKTNQGYQATIIFDV